MPLLCCRYRSSRFLSQLPGGCKFIAPFDTQRYNRRATVAILTPVRKADDPAAAHDFNWPDIRALDLSPGISEP